MAKKLLCTRCLTVGKPKFEMPGNPAFELILWFLCILPGLIYSSWRYSRRRPFCRACGADEMIPLSSPRAQQLLAAAGSSTDASAGAR